MLGGVVVVALDVAAVRAGKADLSHRISSTRRAEDRRGVAGHEVPKALVVEFFFSSRRRHARSDRDWSSDVCSSDLGSAGSQLEERRPSVAAVYGRAEVYLRQLFLQPQGFSRGTAGEGAPRPKGRSIHRRAVRGRLLRQSEGVLPPVAPLGEACQALPHGG